MMSAERPSEQPTGGTSDAQAPASHSAAEALNETKRKFLEALEKKHAHGGRDVSDHSQRSRVGSSRGGSSRKSFRRKSG